MMLHFNDALKTVNSELILFILKWTLIYKNVLNNIIVSFITFWSLRNYFEQFSIYYLQMILTSNQKIKIFNQLKKNLL